MVFGPITSWQIDGETMETVTDFIFFGSKITADGNFSHEVKRHLVLGRKVMTNLDSILKGRHHFADKDESSQSYVFSCSHVWIWELDCKESWVLKSWCFEVWWWWKRLLRVPWTARRLNQCLSCLLHCSGFFTNEPPGKPHIHFTVYVLEPGTLLGILLTAMKKVNFKTTSHHLVIRKMLLPIFRCSRVLSFI